MSAKAAEIFDPHLDRFLSARQYPKTFCPSEVARALSAAELHAAGVSEWRDLMPSIRQRAWQLRGSGLVEVLQRGQVLPSDLRLEDVTGPIRVRKVQS